MRKGYHFIVFFPFFLFQTLSGTSKGASRIDIIGVTRTGAVAINPSGLTCGGSFYGASDSRDAGRDLILGKKSSTLAESSKSGFGRV